jgi:hypothetical protein
MSTDKDIFTKEIESWLGFGYALRKENRTFRVCEACIQIIQLVYSAGSYAELYSVVFL